MGNNHKIGGGGFHHIAIKVRDFDKSMKFYIEGLGFTKSLLSGEGDKRVALLDTGDGNFLELYAGGSKEEKPEGVFIHLAFRTSDCNLASAQAASAGAIITVEPKDITIQSTPPIDARISFFKGFDGETIEFFQYR